MKRYSGVCARFSQHATLGGSERSTHRDPRAPAVPSPPRRAQGFTIRHLPCRHQGALATPLSRRSARTPPSRPHLRATPPEAMRAHARIDPEAWVPSMWCKFLDEDGRDSVRAVLPTAVGGGEAIRSARSSVAALRLPVELAKPRSGHHERAGGRFALVLLVDGEMTERENRRLKDRLAKASCAKPPPAEVAGPGGVARWFAARTGDFDGRLPPPWDPQVEPTPDDPEFGPRMLFRLLHSIAHQVLRGLAVNSGFSVADHVNP
jgi:hypothetical protein